MIKTLVPYGRTHRISVVVAGMLHYALDQTYLKKQESNPFGKILQKSYENDEPHEELFSAIKLLFKKAKVEYTRKNYKGEKFCIIENSLEEFIRWESMPWD
ncbi:hypothetical protein [Fluviispira vulneris]|uniref:hypothetical protein n=1 Tax=Fluviispira vulneris TaxID=2763012 RepID=UPI001647BFBF|nr:hypothetical protein [Fluviispira vulneris]